MSMLSRIRSILFSKPAAVPTVATDKLFKSCYQILHPAKASVGYEIRVGASKVPNAGYGLLVSTGTVQKGDIVALYSGYYFPPPPVWSVATPNGDQPLKPFNINKELPDSLQQQESTAYQIHCNSQGGYIDGIEYTPQSTNNNPHSAASMTKPRTSAQLINHPPAGTQPNVFNTDFSWAEYVQYVQEQKLVGAGEVDKEMDIIEQVNSIGTGPWYYDSWTGKTVMLTPRCAPCAGLATVALRDIHAGEEVYLDYKFHEKDQPDWYTPVVDV